MIGETLEVLYDKKNLVEPYLSISLSSISSINSINSINISTGYITLTFITEMATIYKLTRNAYMKGDEIKSLLKKCVNVCCNKV